MFITLENFRKRIELSLCEQFASDEDVNRFCTKAIGANVGVVCVNPINIPQVVELIRGRQIEISANVGFPFGSHYAEFKVGETKRAVQEGATQIDMVINVGALRSKHDAIVYDEVRSVIDAAQGRIVKVIIESWVLNDEEKVRACHIAEEAGAHLVKTTTGVRTQYLLRFTKDPQGATIKDIKLMRNTLNSHIKIKASGGIYSLDDALAFIKAGADQLGVSRGYELIEEFRQRYKKGVNIVQDNRQR